MAGHQPPSARPARHPGGSAHRAGGFRPGSPIHRTIAADDARRGCARLDVLLRPRTGATPDIVLAGGTARSPDLVQLRADVLGRSLLVDPDADVSLRGAAAIALVGAEIHDHLDEAIRVFPARWVRVDPDLARARTYDQLYRQWHDTHAGLPRQDPGQE